MPYVNLQILTGVTKEQKQALVAAFTENLVTILGKKPEHIHIVIQEIAPENWGFARQLTDTFMQYGN
jgi:4-oxalocrotonate tautomerase